jgi:hypothetical protein
MKKEEADEKRAAAKAEFEAHMKQLQATVAPSASDLLQSLRPIPLSPAQNAEPKLPEKTPESPAAIELPSQSIPLPGPWTSPSLQGPGNPANASNGPKLEALLDTIAEQIKAQRRHHLPLNPRVLVKADSDIFSRVSRVAFARRLDKTEVLTYLLGRYLPEEGRQEPPAWLVQERPDDVLNAFHLAYAEDSEIAVRFTWLEQRFGLLKVDIVAAIVTRYLPASPFVVPPKRRARRKRF